MNLLLQKSPSELMVGMDPGLQQWLEKVQGLPDEVVPEEPPMVPSFASQVDAEHSEPALQYAAEPHAVAEPPAPPAPPPPEPPAAGEPHVVPDPPAHAADEEEDDPGWHQWWKHGKGPLVPDAGPRKRYVPPEHKLTTLGWLKQLDDPTFTWWEHWYLKFLQKKLSLDWRAIQFGTDAHATRLWWEIMQVLELDKKAQLDMMVLAQSGPVGRCHANKIMWDLMSSWATVRTYQDLSNKVSSEVGWARRNFDRPPKGHQDLSWWTWKAYKEPLQKFDHYSPLHAEWASDKYIKIGTGGEPIPPPKCWGEPWDGLQ